MGPGIIWVVADLPAITADSSPETRAAHLRRLLAKGHSVTDIAKRLAPEDKKKQKALRIQMWQLLAQDEVYQFGQGMAAKGILAAELVPVTQALARRARRGRPDAIKLLYEASGFHNPKVKHEHSGEISVKITMPRPEPVQDVVDADVVEE